MQLPTFDERGQAGAVQLQLTLIVSLMVAVIIVYQMFLADVGPTSHIYLNENGVACDAGDIDNIDNTSTWSYNPDYNADALAGYERVQTLAWAGIGLMALAIIILAASVIIGIVHGFGGRGRV